MICIHFSNLSNTLISHASIRFSTRFANAYDSQPYASIHTYNFVFVALATCFVLKSGLNNILFNADALLILLDIYNFVLSVPPITATRYIIAFFPEYSCSGTCTTVINFVFITYTKFQSRRNSFIPPPRPSIS